jgi:uncharacterized protein
MSGSPAMGAGGMEAGRRRGERILVPVATLLREQAGTTRTIDLAGIWIPSSEGPEQSLPAEGELRLTRTNRGVYLTGRMRTTIVEACARCLREIDLPVEITIEEELLPSIDLTTGVAIRGDTEPDVGRLSEAHEIDLGRLLAEGLSLVEPIAPICRPDCPGLCPTCGADLHSGPHEHPESAGDPRLAALAGLRVDADAETG